MWNYYTHIYHRDWWWMSSVCSKCNIIYFIIYDMMDNGQFINLFYVYHSNLYLYIFCNHSNFNNKIPNFSMWVMGNFHLNKFIFYHFITVCTAVLTSLIYEVIVYIHMSYDVFLSLFCNFSLSKKDK